MQRMRKKRYSQLIDEACRNFPIMHQFCRSNFNRFVLFLRKGIYRYEYIDSWERFNETSIPSKEAF